MKKESKRQIEMANRFLDQLAECIDEGCADDIRCLLDNLARAGLRLERDNRLVSSAAYLELLMEQRKAQVTK